MIYKTKPEGFNPRFDVVSCFVEHNGKILLMHRQDHKPEGNTWCLPGGKASERENLAEAMVREIEEETGLIMDSSQVKQIEKVFVRYPSYDFVYNMFNVKIKQLDKIMMNEEHKDFRWVSPEDALKLPLIYDLDSCIKLVFKID